MGRVMKRYLSILCLMVVVLAALSACHEIQGASNLAIEPQSAYEVNTEYENTQDIATEAINWQDAYSYKLRYYARLSIATGTNEAEWRFILHDINQYGIPELILVMAYDNGYVDYRSVYGIVDGSVTRLKTALPVGMDRGMLIPPNGSSGIIRVQYGGYIARYTKLNLSGATLAPVVNGDAVRAIDSFRVNAYPVTEEEFEYIFGKHDERNWLALHEITEDNIRDIIWGWYSTTGS